MAIGFPLASHAQGNCDAVLAGDLFNKVARSESSNSASRTALREWMFSKNEDEAYDIYSQEYESGKQQGQKGSLGASYFGVGGNADFAIDYQNKISRKDFGMKFRAAKAQLQSGRAGEHQSGTSLASAFASHVRDPRSIDAWKACVTSQPTPGLFAFASRDDGGTPYLNVVWAPGPFSGTAPAIRVEIVPPHKDIVVEGGNRDVAVGTGRSYRLDAPDPRKGFSVKVNGDLRSKNGAPLASFSASAQVPAMFDAAAVAAAAGCTGRLGYPLGRWRVSATPPRADYNTFVLFTTKESGTWLPSSGAGSFTVRPALAPQTALVLTYRAANAPSWTSVNSLVVSGDGCSMQGTFDSVGARGEVRYEWEGKP
jgi:hypothetical protein